MPILYDIFIFLLDLGFRFTAFFYKKARLIVEGRKKTILQIKEKITPTDKIIWMHCASLGEFEQGKPVFDAFKKKYPNHKFALSFFSSSGYEVAKNYPPADVVFYLPTDSKKNMQNLICALHPSILVLVKYDYWYNLLDLLYSKNISIIVVSSIFRPNQIFFSVLGSWFLHKLKKNITHFFVQNEASKKLLNQTGIRQVTISGDTRYDAVRGLKNNIQIFPFLDIFCKNHKIIVVGSSWRNDEKLWIKYINNDLLKGVKIIIAPHEINNKKIEKIKLSIHKKTLLYNEINQNKLNENELADAEVLILTTVGLLKNVYFYATIAYVGGGLNKTGVHNVLEPATFGVPVMYGSNFQKYQEAIDLVDCKGGFIIKNYVDLVQIVTSLLGSASLLFEAGKNSLNLIETAPKATHLIIEKISLILPPSFKEAQKKTNFN